MQLSTQPGQQEPEFGWGLGNRPLWSQRDRDAETIREILRRAGCHDWDDEDEECGGFVVAGGHNRAPFLVDCEHDPPELAGELARYREALRAAGYQVEPDPEDDATLRVGPPSGL